MKPSTLITGLGLVITLSACEAIMPGTYGRPCEDQDCVNFRRAAALAIISSGMLPQSQPQSQPQPYFLPMPQVPPRPPTTIIQEVPSYSHSFTCIPSGTAVWTPEFNCK